MQICKCIHHRKVTVQPFNWVQEFVCGFCANRFVWSVRTTIDSFLNSVELMMKPCGKPEHGQDESRGTMNRCSSVEFSIYWFSEVLWWINITLWRLQEACSKQVCPCALAPNRQLKSHHPLSLCWVLGFHILAAWAVDIFSTDMK